MSGTCGTLPDQCEMAVAGLPSFLWCGGLCRVGSSTGARPSPPFEPCITVVLHFRCHSVLGGASSQLEIVCRVAGSVAAWLGLFPEQIDDGALFRGIVHCHGRARRPFTHVQPPAGRRGRGRPRATGELRLGRSDVVTLWHGALRGGVWVKNGPGLVHDDLRGGQVGALCI